MSKKATSKKKLPGTPAPEPPVQKDYAFLHERLMPLGWTEEGNTFTTPAWQFKNSKWEVDETAPSHTHTLFDVDEEGNILIPYYTIHGAPAVYRKGQAKEGSREWTRPYVLKRLRVPLIGKDGQQVKYVIPKGAGTFPWIPPRLIEAYREGRQLDTLVLTEGAFKAYCGALNGMDVIGLTSITHYKDRHLETLHADILELIARCKPKQVVWLVDGDCLSLSSKWPNEDPEVDLFKRPNIFFRSALAIRELLKELANTVGFDVYFAHVNSPAVPGNPKGLDDLLLAYAESVGNDAANKASLKKVEPEAARAKAQAEARQEVVQDLMATVPRFFHRISLERPNPIREYFGLKNAATFYGRYQELIADRPFVYDGTKYQWDGDKNEGRGELAVKVPSVARNYVRVGDTYFERVKIPNKYGDLEEHLHRRDKTTIIDDHERPFLGHIRKLKAFCNVPDHAGYREVINNCFNMYAPFEHELEPGECPKTMEFLTHIFGGGTVKVPHPRNKGEHIELSELDLGLDYLQLLFKKPTQILPILCLVSKERGTGKTTFAKWLKAIYTGNAVFVGNKDLENDFNSAWVSKLLVICDEAFIDKKTVVERIKALSTADKIMMNAKGRDQVEIEFFGKFILLSNNVTSFINTDEDEVRFWVRQIPPIPSDQLNTELETEMYDEIPHFLHFLDRRSMATEKLFRSWFEPSLLVTDALQNVRLHSKPTVWKELRAYLREMFVAAQVEEITMTPEDIRQEVFRGRYEANYINEVIKDHKLAERYSNAGKQVATRYSFFRIAERREESDDVKETVVLEVKRPPGRPYVFKRSLFFAPEDWALYQVNDEAGGRALMPPPKAAQPSLKGDDDSEVF